MTHVSNETAPTEAPERANMLRTLGKDTDMVVRDRLTRNLRLLFDERRFKDTTAMAAAIKVSRGALSNYLLGNRTIGLDVLLNIREHLHVSIDWMVSNEAPAVYSSWPLRSKVHTDEGAEAAEYIESLPDPEVRKQVRAAVGKLIPKMKREHERQKKSG